MCTIQNMPIMLEFEVFPLMLTKLSGQNIQSEPPHLSECKSQSDDKQDHH
jgi:hypothetical protein